MAGRFTRTAQRVLRLTGDTTFAEVERSNGGQGRIWCQAIQRVVSQIPDLVSSNLSVAANLLKMLKSIVLDKYPKAAKYEIQGARAHRSHDDRSDPEPEIKLRVYDENDKRLVSFHVHVDGTFKHWPSRKGRRGGRKKEKKTSKCTVM